MPVGKSQSIIWHSNWDFELKSSIWGLRFESNIFGEHFAGKIVRHFDLKPSNSRKKNSFSGKVFKFHNQMLKKPKLVARSDCTDRSCWIEMGLIYKRQFIKLPNRFDEQPHGRTPPSAASRLLRLLTHLPTARLLVRSLAYERSAFNSDLVSQKSANSNSKWLPIDTRWNWQFRFDFIDFKWKIFDLRLITSRTSWPPLGTRQGYRNLIWGTLYKKLHMRNHIRKFRNRPLKDVESKSTSF